MTTQASFRSLPGEGLAKQDHQLQWAVDNHFTTDVGRCTCEWRCWSPHKAEIIEAHEHHRAYVKRQQDDARQSWRHREADIHTVRWNAWGISCTGCDWKLVALRLSTAHQIVAFNHHVQDIIEASTEPPREG